MYTKEQNDLLICLSATASMFVFFLIGVFDLPYGYYTFLRIFTFIANGIFLAFFYGYKGCFSPLFVPTIAIAVFWNPLLPISLTKSIWSIADLIAACFEFVMSIYILYKFYKTSNDFK